MISGGIAISHEQLKVFPPRPQLNMEITGDVVKHLCHRHVLVNFVGDRTVIFLEFTLEELELANKELK